MTKPKFRTETMKSVEPRRRQSAKKQAAAKATIVNIANALAANPGRGPGNTLLLSDLVDATPKATPGARDMQEGGAHYLNAGKDGLSGRDWDNIARTSRLEPWDVIKAFQLDFFAGNAVKYLLRAKAKGNYLQDLKKALHYITELIEQEEARNAD